MKSFRYIPLVALPLVFAAACAVDPMVVPAQQSPAANQTVGTTGPVVREELIAECNHVGAPTATVSYPDGWTARLAQTSRAGSAGDELLGGRSTPASIVDRDAQPITQPWPTYPDRAVIAQREGLCYAMMDVTTDGRPENILTACSSADFNAPTYQAATQMRFEPLRTNGTLARRINVVYPMEYCLQD
ncbi:energy transducer TonB [Henriciella litoralis]|uniref:energy transducer TonB n=1 Tax=Henriciella litoralis TaxID=568102 RepID=UPI000A07ADB7|nr:energy transducer TonB [Henriciella litoralis]